MENKFVLLKNPKKIMDLKMIDSQYFLVYADSIKRKNLKLDGNITFFPESKKGYIYIDRKLKNKGQIITHEIIHGIFLKILSSKNIDKKLEKTIKYLNKREDVIDYIAFCLNDIYKLKLKKIKQKKKT